MGTRFNPPIPHEFVEPNASDTFIWWLYKRRCIMCNQLAHEINEINPRSRGKGNINDWRNRVTLCAECHREYHADGVTEIKMARMALQRDKFLVMIGRSEYLEA